VDPITLLPTPHRRRFTKRAPITITNGGAAALTNYQVKVTVTYDADMQADFSDRSEGSACGLDACAKLDSDGADDCGWR